MFKPETAAKWAVEFVGFFVVAAVFSAFAALILWWAGDSNIRASLLIGLSGAAIVTHALSFFMASSVILGMVVVSLMNACHPERDFSERMGFVLAVAAPALAVDAYLDGSGKPNSVCEIGPTD